MCVVHNHLLLVHVDSSAVYLFLCFSFFGTLFLCEWDGQEIATKSAVGGKCAQDINTGTCVHKVSDAHGGKQVLAVQSVSEGEDATELVMTGGQVCSVPPSLLCMPLLSCACCSSPL